MGIQDQFRNDYVAVAASAAAQSLGDNGQKGDVLMRLIITPAVAAAGIVSITDGSGSAINVFAGGGTTALPSLAPVTVEIQARSVTGAWKVTTGAGISVIAVGRFT